MTKRSEGLFRDLTLLPHGKIKSVRVFRTAKDNVNFVQRLELQSKLKVHNGCVNTTSWNDSGTLILSGSDDQHLVVTNPYSEKVLTDFHTGHRANIFCARFLPFTGDNEVVSCSGDGKICYTNLEYHDGSSNMFDCHMATAYKVVVVPGDSHTFLSCGEDGTVRWFDLRIKTSCQKDDCQEDVLINCGRATCSLAVNPMLPWQLATGCADSTIRIYDRRMLSTLATGGEKNKSLHSMLKCFSPPGFTNVHRRITSINYDDTGQQLLASYSSDSVYLFDIVESEEDKELKVEKPLNGDSAACEHHEECDTESSNDSNRPLSIHKLRLRGDWSDTGPNARPERERQQHGEVNPAENVMQRMSTMLTRWLENHARDNPSEQSTNEATSSPQESPREEAMSTTTQNESTHQTAINESSRSDEPVLELSNLPDTEKEDTNIASEQTKQDSILANNDILPNTNVAGCSESKVNLSVLCDTEGKKTTGNKENKQVSDVVDNKISSDASAASCSVSKLDLAVVHNPSSQNQAMLSSHMCKVEEICDKSKCLEISNQNLGNSELLLLEENVHEPTDISNNDNSKKVTGEIGIGAKPKIRLEVCSVDQSSNDSQPSTTGLNKVNITSKTNETEHNLHPETRDLSLGHFKNTDKSNADVNIVPSSSSTCIQEVSKDTVENSGDVNVEADNDKLEKRNKSDKRQPIQKKSLSQPEFNQLERRRSSMDSQSSFASDSEDERSTRTNEALFSNLSNQSTAPTALSRSSAARRLQTMFRRHREEKAQREEQENLLRMKLPQPVCLQSYSGHRNARTMIKEANFWGNSHVLCGSDCGHLFIWDRNTGKLINLLEADKHVVNCVQPHPFEPILATSGIDYDVKLWAPTAKCSTFNEETATMVMDRNRVMLRETRDTVTVPASFMLRLIASIHRVERARQVEQDTSE